MEPTSQRAEPGGTLAATLKAVAIVAVTGGLAAAARELFHVQDVEMPFLLGVLVTALMAGRTSALAAAALAVGVFERLDERPGVVGWLGAVAVAAGLGAAGRGEEPGEPPPAGA